ncbi:thiosulfate oxidation carrier protein SoxY [bacterium]|nr:thiosulfate oxidation carrier protein SoxY [bacterium]MBU1957833.1 thiosulfate oxidation carrier protein SoxY [bacterium]
MDRRKFLGLGMVALALVPATSLHALDFRKEKPDTWTAQTVDDAIKALYGATATESKDITLKAPKVASNGGAIPVTIKTSIDAKTVAMFQDANPESAVAVWTVPEGGIVNYTTKIKMKKSGTITVIVEDKAGKLHSVKQTLEVALGGCEG